MAEFATNSWGVFAAGYQGKNIWLDYVQEVYKKKSYLKPGINSNGALSINVDGSALTYYVLPTHGVQYGDLGGLHTAASGQVKGLSAKTVSIVKGEIIDALIPAAAKLAGAATVEAIFAQNVVKAVNNINERFVETIEKCAREIDTAGLCGALAANTTYGISAISADTSYTAANKLTYSAQDVVGSITKLKAAFNKKNAQNGFKATSLFVSSDVYADMQAKNLLIFKPIMLEGGDQVEVYNFLGMDVTEVPEMADFKVVMIHRDGVFSGANLDFVVENENDPSVPGGVSIKGEMGHAEGPTQMGPDFAGYLIVGIK